jgi:hypothetical protein
MGMMGERRIFALAGRRGGEKCKMPSAWNFIPSTEAWAAVENMASTEACPTIEIGKRGGLPYNGSPNLRVWGIAAQASELEVISKPEAFRLNERIRLWRDWKQQAQTLGLLLHALWGGMGSELRNQKFAVCGKFNN